MLLGAILIYIVFHFIILCKVGFYKNSEEDRKSNLLLKYFPLFILILLLSSTLIGYRMDIKASMKNTTDEPIINTDDIYSEREKIISDSTLNIAERFQKLQLGGYGKNASIVYFTYEISNEDITNNAKSLKEYYNKFNLIPTKNKSERLKIKNDTLIIKLGNGKIRKEKVNSNSKSFIEYMEDQNVFIFENKDQSSECKYFSINGVTGEKFCGVPIFGNQKSKLYSDLFFERNNEKVDLNLRFWIRNGVNSYEMILFEKIPMSYYFEKYSIFPCNISNIYWNDETFNFILTAILNGKEERLKIIAKVLIQG
jgi:hypothetical protein